ncbi:PIN domain-containing protein [Nocardioides panzhihuensis]|uniref:Putative nucleic acid-binding protein n=1 Tax=Nocardioides panzhihuensis TaxID=860243 RepID=A0A7Z0DQS4_9ACTN|nr:putative nucleic acid-binding protein [Nocardioides panzhihuensis]
MLVYVDTSAMAKRFADEPESDALDEHLNALIARGNTVISSVLLDVELTRVARRERLDPATVEAVLADVGLVGIFPEVLEAAKDIEFHLKALDSIHLGTALILQDEAEGDEAVEQVVTYDDQMARVAEKLGFEVVSPGRP